MLGICCIIQSLFSAALGLCIAMRPPSPAPGLQPLLQVHCVAARCKIFEIHDCSRRNIYTHLHFLAFISSLILEYSWCPLKVCASSSGCGCPGDNSLCYSFPAVKVSHAHLLCSKFSMSEQTALEIAEYVLFSWL